MDYEKYEEVDRSNAFKSRKKTGKWCKGKRGDLCTFVRTENFSCYWLVSTPKWPKGNTQRRAIWKCGCQVKCTKCGRMRRFTYGSTGCGNLTTKYRTEPTDPNITISRW
jgi:hypothetical protein